MTDHCADTNSFGRAGSGFRSAEVSYREMVARATYAVVHRIADAHRAWARRRAAVKALNYLSTLDDRHLADIGLSRSELTIAGLRLAAEKRDSAHFMTGYRP